MLGLSLELRLRAGWDDLNAIYMYVHDVEDLHE